MVDLFLNFTVLPLIYLLLVLKAWNACNDIIQFIGIKNARSKRAAFSPSEWVYTKVTVKVNIDNVAQRYLGAVSGTKVMFRLAIRWRYDGRS